MTKLVARIKVILRALPTYMVGAAVVLTLLAPEIAKLLPSGIGEHVASWLIKIAAFLGAAVAIIRKVTPVAPSQVGILPQGPPSSPVVVIPQTPPLDVPGGQNDPGGN